MYVITISNQFIVAEFIVDSAHIKADMAIESGWFNLPWTVQPWSTDELAQACQVLEVFPLVKDAFI